jgi:uncharacterized membrane protein YedE/YeeE
VKPVLSAFGAGLLFGIGLLVSGMTDPHRVRAFLDFTGHWDPSLAGVMAGAIAVHGTALWLERRRAGASIGVQAPIDARLIGGAAVFGVGWGLAGYCPGPAIVSLGYASLGYASLGYASLGYAPGRAWVFFATMVVGVVIGDAIGSRRASRDANESMARTPAC